MILAAEDSLDEALASLPPLEPAGIEPFNSEFLPLARAEIHWLAGDLEQARRLAGQLLESLLDDHELARALRFPEGYHSIVARVAHWRTIRSGCRPIWALLRRHPIQSTGKNWVLV